MVLDALTKANLYCSVQKSSLFCTKVDFLSHHISHLEIEANPKKINCIVNWLVPNSATVVWAFLGLVRYVADFLPALMNHTSVLTPLTHKGTDTKFPTWPPEHQHAFQSIEKLVLSCDFLIDIDHDNMGENQIFITWDASECQTGMVLSFGKSWETAHPVAFDSVSLKDAQENYPVHEKELLAIICTLTKWRTELLSSPITIYTDHCTLENFDSQKDLSQCQACWQEFLAHYNHHIVYIKGEDNTVADTLSHLPDSVDHAHITLITAIFSISSDPGLLQRILAGYESDPFCVKLQDATTSIPGLEIQSNLIYIGSCLVVP